jgi:hypothetical protein
MTSTEAFGNGNLSRRSSCKSALTGPLEIDPTLFVIQPTSQNQPMLGPTGKPLSLLDGRIVRPLCPEFVAQLPQGVLNPASGIPSE